MNKQLPLELFQENIKKSSTNNNDLQATLNLGEKIGEAKHGGGYRSLFFDNNSIFNHLIIDKKSKIILQRLINNPVEPKLQSAGKCCVTAINDDEIGIGTIYKRGKQENLGIFVLGKNEFLRLPDINIKKGTLVFNLINIGKDLVYEIKIIKGNENIVCFYDSKKQKFIKFDNEFYISNHQIFGNTEVGEFVLTGNLLHHKIYVKKQDGNYESLQVENAHYIYGIGLVVNINGKWMIIDKLENGIITFKKYEINNEIVDMFEDLPTKNCINSNHPGKAFFSLKHDGKEYIVIDGKIIYLNFGNKEIIAGFDSLTKNGKDMLGISGGNRYKINWDKKNLYAKKI